MSSKLTCQPWVKILLTLTGFKMCSCKSLGLLINSKLSSFQQGKQTVYHVWTNEQTSSLNCSIRPCVCVTFLPFGWEQEIRTVKMQLCSAAALQNIPVTQHFWVVYHGISHESFVFSRYTHKSLSECVYQENTSDK